MLARASGRGSAFGEFLHITLDMAAYSALLTGVAVIQPEGGVVWALVLMGYLMVTSTTLALSRLLEEQSADAWPGNNCSLQFTPGFAEAGETTVVQRALLATRRLAERAFVSHAAFHLPVPDNDCTALDVMARGTSRTQNSRAA